MMIRAKNIFTLVIGFILITSSAFAATNACYSTAELNDFKTIYVQLQQQLNYEGQDAFLDKKFQVQLRPHAKGTPYGGKEFELAMFGEYQNSLKKVGRLFQAAKFEGDENFKSNPLLVKFMEAIEEKNSSSTEFIQNTKIKEVITALEDASIKKFGSTTDKKFVLNAGDKYLLEKLLTHAQDRICNLITFDKNGNQDTHLFKKDYLQKVKNAPLNRIVNTLKTAQLNKDSKIELSPSDSLTASLVDPNAVVQSALADNLNQLSQWVKKVKSRGDKCLEALKSKSFANSIQANIQTCNLGHFIDTISEDNFSNLEAILHYINANERLLNFAQAKAETGLEALELEKIIDSTYSNLGKKVGCTLVNSENGQKKLFVRNISYENGVFDYSKISCKIKGKELSPSDCAKKIEFVSDEFGRGLEVRQKAKSGAPITLSVIENPECTDVGLSAEEAPVLQSSLLTEDICKKKSEELGIEMVLNEDKTECIRRPRAYVERPMTEFKTDEICKLEGKAQTPPVDLVADKDHKKCIPRVSGEMNADKCKILAEKEKKPLVFDPIKKTCEEAKDEMDADKCRVKAEKEKKPLVFDPEKKTCEEKAFEDKCAEEGLKKTPPEFLILGPDKKSCIEDGQKKCEADNAKWIEEKNNGGRAIKFSWNSKTNSCEDKKPDPKSEKEKGGDSEGEDDAPVNPKQAPQRFVPINTPTRQMWVAPGAQ
jgi:hypothetical protein